jgi:uncharacterized protein (TIGR03437 family)
MGQKHTVKAFALLNLLFLLLGFSHQVQAQIKDFVSVDAASYQFAVAPNTIAAGFTQQVTAQTAFATDADPLTDGIQLPTLLGGIRVTVNNRLAGLLAVTPNQINYLVPGDTEVDGPAAVVVTDEQGAVLAQGTLNMVTSTLSIFTFSQNGVGAPAALFTGDGVTYNLVVNPDGSANIVPAGNFLILFGTGLRGADPANIKAFIGGVEALVTYAGEQPDFLGLDQINLQVPASLANQGLLELVLSNGSATSNKVTINLGGNPTAPAGAPVITGLSETTALAGEVITLTGTNFPTSLEEATVRLGAKHGQVVSTSATSLTFIVPFGAATDKITAGNAAGERQSDATLAITTSISGAIISPEGNPLAGLPVFVRGTNIVATTDDQGRFLLAGVPAGTVRVDIDAASTPYVSEAFTLVVSAGRDNEVGAPIALLQDDGVGLDLSAESSTTQGVESASNGSTQPRVISHDGIKLEIPGAVTFPNGANTGRLGLKRLPVDSRLPMTLPAGVYPSVMVLITPRETTFGAKDGTNAATLVFPNPDQLPAGASLDLYAYRTDVTPSAFVKRGTATVSSNGEKITAAGLIDMATIWFIGLPSDQALMTKVIGVVTDSQDKPVSGARVHVRGRSSVTDREGKFAINGVRAKNGDELRIEAIYFTPAGLPLKAGKAVNAVVPGETDAGTIKLPAEPPLVILIRPTEVKLSAGETAQLKVVLSKPLATAAHIALVKAEGVELTITPASLQLDPGQTEAEFTVLGATPGKAILKARLAAATGAIAAEQARHGYAVVYVRLAAPTLSSIAPASGAPGDAFTLTGTGFDPEPRHNAVFFKQGERIVLADPGKFKIAGTTLQGVVPGLKAGAAEVFLVKYQEGVLSEPSNKLNFTVTAPSAPVLSSITPGSGLPGMSFTLTGTGFDPEARRNAVFFKQGERIIPVEASLLKITPAANTGGTMTIAGKVPRMPAGAAEVFVVVFQEGIAGAASNKLAFTIEGLPAPVLTGITPNEGLPGATFTLTGTGFDPEVRRNGVFFKQGERILAVDPTTLKLTSATNANGSLTIEGKVPKLSPGAAEVFVAIYLEGHLGATSNKLQFTITAPPAPVLSSITPNEGAPGTTFTLTGSGFNPDAERNVVVFKQGERVVTVHASSLRVATTPNGVVGFTGLVPELPPGAAEVFAATKTNDLSSAFSNKLAFTVKARTTQ